LDSQLQYDFFFLKTSEVRQKLTLPTVFYTLIIKSEGTAFFFRNRCILMIESYV